MNRDERLIFKQYMSEGHPPEMLLDRVGPVMLLRLAIEIVYEEVAMYTICYTQSNPLYTSSTAAISGSTNKQFLFSRCGWLTTIPRLSNRPSFPTIVGPVQMPGPPWYHDDEEMMSNIQ